MRATRKEGCVEENCWGQGLRRGLAPLKKRRLARFLLANTRPVYYVEIRYDYFFLRTWQLLIHLLFKSRNSSVDIVNRLRVVWTRNRFLIPPGIWGFTFPTTFILTPGFRSSCSVIIRGSLRNKATRPWSWPLISVYCLCSEEMQV
jgi:hypothetical protein